MIWNAKSYGKFYKDSRALVRPLSTTADIIKEVRENDVIKMHAMVNTCQIE